MGNMSSVSEMNKLLSPTALKVALQSPQLFCSAMSKSTFQVIWDSGASVSISPDKADFVDLKLSKSLPSVQRKVI